MKLTSSIGTILLAVYLILTALSLFGVSIPAVILGILAIAAGALLLFSR